MGYLCVSLNRTMKDIGRIIFRTKAQWLADAALIARYTGVERGRTGYIERALIEKLERDRNKLRRARRALEQGDR